MSNLIYRGTANRKCAKAILFATLLLGQHCGPGTARQILQTGEHHRGQNGQATHWTVEYTDTMQYDPDPMQGLRPPGNPTMHLQLTEQGRYMYSMIIRKLEESNFQRDLRLQMQTIARPLVHRLHVHRQALTSASGNTHVSNPVQISLEQALSLPKAKTAFGMDNPRTRQGNTSMAGDHRCFQGSTEGAPNGEHKGRFSLHVGADVFVQDRSLTLSRTSPRTTPRSSQNVAKNLSQWNITSISIQMDQQHREETNHAALGPSSS